ncbi:AAA family ATPase [Paracrocinitomix mangrovi]|uniref:ATP-dependent DNA helicase n=1 Tax=Paracrocinitomix mangrovi TaxID=2862509 RepID=UPI001C8DDE9C|nr:AAA family ATPase [Paracrocinitomix mangrovi]UKN01433.1 AAA family ATPase [Paracrocinitomix mangrovi]
MKNKLDKLSFRQQFAKNLTVDPTNDQNVAIDRLTDFITSDKQFEVFLLSGFAGTGKTTLISTFVNTLSDFKIKSYLMAPTGRAAKVLSNYSGKRAHTIHRSIYFINSAGDGNPHFKLGQNKRTNTIFIVDEASMVSTFSGITDPNSFSPRDLLEDLFEYVYSADNCKLIFVGDKGQLPPVGMDTSPALDPKFLQQQYSFDIITSELKDVVRQTSQSGVLDISLQLREFTGEVPRLNTNKKDAIALNGYELQETIEWAFDNYGQENVMIVTRSNKRANQFNQQIRLRILWQEDDINAGDVLMVVHNNYFWLDPKSEAGFVANGELIKVNKIVKREEVFGWEFVQVLANFLDYPNMEEQELKIMTKAIHTESANVPRDQLKELFYRIASEEYPYERNKRMRNKKVMENPYFQALQVKFGYAVTVHKSQGGQWPVVFIDQGYFTDDMWSEEYMRWLYTAITRASEKVYLVNFSEEFVGEES